MRWLNLKHFITPICSYTIKISFMDNKSMRLLLLKKKENGVIPLTIKEQPLTKYLRVQ